MSLPRLHIFYKDVIAKQLRDELHIKFLPKLSKIVLNSGAGKAVSNKKYLEVVASNMTKIAIQKSVVTLAKKSESGFGIRAGWPIGCKVTLRRAKMYEFLDRFLNTVVPRIPDFSGLNPKSFDGQGNYTYGIPYISVFPECDLEQEKIGLDITFVTTANTDKVAHQLLSLLGFPFKQK